MPVNFQRHLKSCIRSRNWLGSAALGGNLIEKRPKPYSLLSQAFQAMFSENGKSPNLKAIGPNSDDTVRPRKRSARFSGVTICDTQGSIIEAPKGPKAPSLLARPVIWR